MKPRHKRISMKAITLLAVLSLCMTLLQPLAAIADAADTAGDHTAEAWTPTEEAAPALNTAGDLTLEQLQTAQLAQEDTPEIVSAEAIEEKAHVNRLWEQEEDLNSIVFQNRDGSKTMYYYSTPVKYVDEAGEVKDKSNEITVTAEGDYTNADNDIRVYFPKKLHKNKGVELTVGEHTVEMSPDIQGTSGASRQTGHNKEFDPTEYVVYPAVFDESTAIRYTPTFEGYKEDILLEEYTGQHAFPFILRTDGLSLVCGDDGQYHLSDPLTGEQLATIGDLVVYDSSDTTDDLTYTHEYKIETVTADEEYIVTILVNEAFLTDPTTVYPVTVDPTIEVSGSGNTKTIQDAPIYDGRPYTAHDTHSAYTVIGAVPNWDGTYFGVGRTLMRFPGLMNNSVFSTLSSDAITEVTLHMYQAKTSLASNMSVYYYTGVDWTESTATCANISWNGYGSRITFLAPGSYGWKEIDLTSAAKDWVTGTASAHKGIMLKNNNESNGNYQRQWLSTNSATSKPYLTFDWEDPLAGKVFRINSSVNPGEDNSTPTYMHASGSEEHSMYAALSSLSDVNGAQFWYIESLNNGYYQFINLGYRHSASFGREDYVLTVNSNGEAILDKNTKGYNQQWQLQSIGNKYYLVNRSDITSVLVVEEGNYLPHLGSRSAISLWSLEAVEIERFFTDTSYTYKDNETYPIQINFVVEDSAITEKIDYLLYQQAGYSWNNINPNIHVGVYRAGDTNIPSGINIKILGVPNLSTESMIVYGRARIWCSDPSYIKNGEIYINTTQDLFDDPSKDTSYASENAQATIAHEMGHILQLTHLSDESDAYPELQAISVMNSGLASQNHLITIKPSIYDMINLNNRWSDN